MDQSYYSILVDTSTRDKDQVVQKYARKKFNKNDTECPMLMVDQCWLWILGGSRSLIFLLHNMTDRLPRHGSYGLPSAMVDTERPVGQSYRCAWQYIGGFDSRYNPSQIDRCKDFSLFDHRPLCIQYFRPCLYQKHGSTLYAFLRRIYRRAGKGPI